MGNNFPITGKSLLSPWGVFQDCLYKLSIYIYKCHGTRIATINVIIRLTFYGYPWNILRHHPNFGVGHSGNHLNPTGMKTEKYNRR